MAPSSSRSQSSRSRVPENSTRSLPSDIPTLPASLSNLIPPASPYISPYAPITTQQQDSATTIYSPQPTLPATSGITSLLSESFPVDFQPRAGAMSTYSSSSQDSIYSTQGLQRYSVLTPGMMGDPQKISEVSVLGRVCMIAYSCLCDRKVYILDRRAGP